MARLQRRYKFLETLNNDVHHGLLIAKLLNYSVPLFSSKLCLISTFLRITLNGFEKQLKATLQRKSATNYGLCILFVIVILRSTVYLAK